MAKAFVLELVDPGSILVGEFLEGHEFTTRHGRFGGRTHQGAESVDLAYKGLGDIVSLHSQAVSRAPSTCFAMCALNGRCNQFHFIPFQVVLREYPGRNVPGGFRAFSVVYCS